MDLSGHEREIPIPITSTYVVHHHHLHTNSSSSTIKKNNNITEATEEGEGEEEEEEQSKKQLVLLGGNSGGGSSSTRVVRYRECLKNHAASMGGSATDGCGEFMASGEEGSLEALKCSACSCHRNFHRKEIEGEPPFQHLYHYSKNQASRHYCMPTSRPPPAALIMPLGAAAAAAAAESDQETDNGGYGMMMMMRGSASHSYGNVNNNYSSSCGVKKRFRTKFTQEQKEKMLGFAERVGWKLQRQEEGSVQQLCQEIGVKRRVLKVWMHNNKHSFINKNKSNNNNNNNTNSSNSSSLHIQ